ncbi:hypothetical protein SAMN06269117_11353 [Balnearium lithotrophicum]|uniref:Uncharacterized protein n=1 Tax=Balnearium lithotrophicum TaxID=223788 RepID=A0A521CK07_9BACT|nr:hypothetical protein [Balnearium lithotrophicum]SMO59735.1 hypothetical protein SAMN06269117_11353 [Balnearium lithotrophicum]
MRGCGERKDKAFYLESTPSPDGAPIEDFIFDLPIPINQEPFRAPILYRDERTGIYHVLIWVGKKFYESPWDFIREAEIKGISRRIPKNFPIQKLSPGSKMLFVHSDAIIQNWQDLVKEIKKQGITKIPCPKMDPKHSELKENCMALLYYVLKGKETGDRGKYGKWVDRTVGDLTYSIPNPLEKLNFQPVFQTGIFLYAPITNIAYISKDGQVEESVKEIAQECKLPVVVKEE